MGRLNYSRRCAEASAVQAHVKWGISLAPGMEIGYVAKDAKSGSRSGEDRLRVRCKVLPKAAEKAWEKVAFAFQ